MPETLRMQRSEGVMRVCGCVKVRRAPSTKPSPNILRAMGLDTVVRRAGRSVEGRDALWSASLSFGITPIERRASLCICVLVRSQLEYTEAQSIECRHAESADIMDSWDWRTPGSWIWRTLLSPHRLAVRSTEQAHFRTIRKP